MAYDELPKYEIIEKIAELDSDSESPKELRLISWYGSEPKYDIRNWWTDRKGNERMSKGCTFDKEELYSLYEVLKNIFESED